MKTKTKTVPDAKTIQSVDNQLKYACLGMPAWVDTRNGRVHGFLCKQGWPQKDKKEAMLITAIRFDARGDRKYEFKIYPWHRISCPQLNMYEGRVRKM